MFEPKSRFATRIGKTMDYVAHNVRRGHIVVNERGFVDVERSLDNLSRIRRGRPRVGFWDKKVRVFVKRKNLNRIGKIDN